MRSRKATGAGAEETRLFSIAFGNEGAGGDPPPSFTLPEVDSPYYDEVAAWALIQGAGLGDSLAP